MTRRTPGRASGASSARGRRRGGQVSRGDLEPAERNGSSTARRSRRAPVRVLLYSARGCAQCRRAKAFLEARGIAFSELDVGRSPKARKALARMGARGVPTILIGDHRLDGFSERRFLEIYQELSDA